MRPLLSVVIANYNYGRFLEDAIQSVITQDAGDQVELIICDAASTDNSVEIIRKYSSKIAWWCSEKDKGQSDAFNKGFAHAHGRFLTWLNADDILLPGTFSALHYASIASPECEWFTGNFLQFKHHDGEITFAPWGPHFLPKFLQGPETQLMIFGPTTFWTREAYAKVGPIDINLHYSMDTDYWIRMKIAGYQQGRINHCCWAFRLHEESKTAQYEERDIDMITKQKWFEELRVIHKRHNYYPRKRNKWLTRLWRLIDGSLAVALYRRCFIVGRDFQKYLSY